MQLQIEPVAHCNAACVFCPYPDMKRKRGLMDMGLFHKIIDEAAGIERFEQITLTGLGETLLDPHLIERVRYIRERVNSGMMIDLYTNGSFLTEDRVIGLRDAGLTVLYVSLNAVRSEQRKAIMRLDDFDKVCAQIDRAIEIAGPMKVCVKAVFNKDLFEGGDNEEFTERWGGTTDKGGHAFLHLEGNWAGAMWPMRITPQKACSRALNEVMVMWDGRVSLCCFDGEGEVVFGDLNNQTIRDVFSSEKAQFYRQSHVEGRRNELFLCRTCTAI